MKIYFLVFFLWGHYLVAGTIAALEGLSAHDKSALEAFFHQLCREDAFAYTLFGDKPMSFTAYLSAKYERASSYCVLEKGWETWCRYAHLFPSSEFVLKKESHCDFHQTRNIWIIHKGHVLATILKNLDLFQQKFGEHFNPQEFVDQLCCPDVPMNSLLEDDILGLLLGFGRTNAVTFKRLDELRSCLESAQTPPFAPISPPPTAFNNPLLKRRETHKLSKAPSPSELASFREEWESILKSRNIFTLPGNDHFLDFVAVPSFVEHERDDELLDSYIQTRSVIRTAYQEGSFLQVTLQRWMGVQ